MNQIDIRSETHISLQEVIPLYTAVGWSNYTNHPEMLAAALAGSLRVMAARRSGKLIGLIRAVGDGHSILYLQDILVLPEYQGMGVGKRLIEAMDAAFPQVYQKVLLTDNTPKTVAFYGKCGFTPAEKMGCTAFVQIKT